MDQTCFHPCRVRSHFDAWTVARRNFTYLGSTYDSITPTTAFTIPATTFVTFVARSVGADADKIYHIHLATVHRGCSG
jgi:hypothetical protein